MFVFKFRPTFDFSTGMTSDLRHELGNAHEDKHVHLLVQFKLHPQDS